MQALALQPLKEPVEPPFEALAKLPLIVLVGLTGVGKTTAASALIARHRFDLLPNRRSIADDWMIPAMLEESGEPAPEIRDRLQRFEMTARYRARFPGGTAHALGRLMVDTGKAAGPFLFDGLRGFDEVSWACRHMAESRFICLDAPALVRLHRLLGRGETFDRVDSVASPSDLAASMAELEGIERVFGVEMIQQICSDPDLRGLDPQTILQKVAIIVQERRHYDSAEAARFLQDSLPARRYLGLDTDELGPHEVAAAIAEWV